MDAHTHTHATNPKEFQPVTAIGTNLKENKIGQAYIWCYGAGRTESFDRPK